MSEEFWQNGLKTIAAQVTHTHTKGSHRNQANI